MNAPDPFQKTASPLEKAFFNHSLCAVLLVSPEGKALRANAVFDEYADVPPGAPFWIAFGENGQGDETETLVLQRTPSGLQLDGEEEFVVELPVETADGASRLRFSFEPVKDEEGKTAAFLGLSFPMAGSGNGAPRQHSAPNGATAQAKPDEKAELLNIVAEKSNVPIVVTEAETGKILYANDALAGLIQYKKDELIGRVSPDFYAVAEDREQLLAQLKSNGFVDSFETSFRRKDGSGFWAQASLYVTQFRGRPCIAGSIISVDELKNARLRLAESRQQLEEALRMAQLGGWELDLATFEMKFDPRHSQWLDPEAPGELAMSFTDFTRRFMPAAEVPTINDAIRRVAVAEMPDFQDTIETRLTDAEGRTKFLRISVKGVYDQFNIIEKVIASCLDITEARQVGAELQQKNEELIAQEEELRQNLDELYATQQQMQETQRELERRENFFSSIFEGSRDAIVLIKGQTIFECNEYAVKMLGAREKSEVVGKSPALFSPETQPGGRSSQEVMTENLDRAIKTGRASVEWQHKRLDGSLFYSDITLSVLELDGEQVIQSIARDITDRKEIEQKLDARQQELEQAMDIAQLSTWRLDLQQFILYLDLRHCQWMGVKPNQGDEYALPISEFMQNYVHPEDAPAMQQAAESLLAEPRDGYRAELQYRLRNARGAYMNMNTDIRLELDEAGAPKMGYGTTQDVTETREMELRLRQNENRLRDAMKMARMGLWRINPDSQALVIDQSAASILGIPLSEGAEYEMPFRDYIQKFVVEHHRAYLNEIVEAFIEKGSSDNFENFEYQLRDAEGRLRYIMGTIRGVFSEDGAAISLYGAVQDLTEAKEKEAAALENARKLDSAFKIANVALWEENLENQSLVFDRKHQEWLGLPDPQDQLEVPMMEFAEQYVVPEDRGIMLAAIERGIQAPEKEVEDEFEFRIVNLRGELTYIRVLSHIIKDDDGNRLKVYGVSLDVTEERKREIEILENSRKLDSAFKIANIALWEQNPETFAIIFDRRHQEWLGLPEPQDTMEINLEEFAEKFVVPEDRDLLPEAVKKGMASPEKELENQFEMRVINLKGELNYIQVLAYIVKDDAGNLKQIYGVSLDVTEERVAAIEKEAAVERQKVQSEALAYLSKSEIVYSGNLNLAYQMIIENGLASLDVARFGVWRYNAEKDVLRKEMLFDAKEIEYFSGHELSREEAPGFFACISEMTQPLALQYANYAKETSELKDTYFNERDVNSVVIAPVRHGGKFWGIIMFEHSGVSRKWHEDEVQFAGSIAEVVTLAIQAKERADALEKLRLSEATFSALAQNAPGVIFQLYLDLTKGRMEEQLSFSYFSPAASGVLGLDAGAAQDSPAAFFERIAETDREAARSAFARSAAEQEELKWEGRFDSAGKEIWLQIIAQPDALDEETLLYNGFMFDITERKTQQLHDAEMRRRAELYDESFSEITSPEYFSGYELDEAFQKTMASVSKTLAVESSSIWFLNAGAHRFEFGPYYGKTIDGDAPAAVIRDEAPEIYTALLAAKPITVRDAGTEGGRFSEHIQQTGLIAVAAAPLFRSGSLAGYIVAESKTPRDWQEDEINYLTNICDAVSLMIEASERQAALDDLRVKEAELSKLNNALQSTVEERTKAYEELKEAQRRLVQSEKMASLGQLVAGVAHEINTPISAVKASTRNLIRALPTVLTETPMLLRALADEPAALFMDMVNQSSTAEQEFTTQEEREYRKVIKQTLEDYDVDNSFELSKELVEVRIVKDIEKFIPLFEAEDSEEVIDKVYKLGQFKKNLDNIELAADKTARVALALKNYARTQNEENFSEIFLHESIDTILTIYHNTLKYGVVVEKDYDKTMKPVMAYPDEIGQVWTNIISNAVHAMKGEGKLKVSVAQDGDEAVVKIADNGPGIPPDIKDRIFEPFFTTKSEGEGTGLGLDICRKIVEQHSGHISVESEPGNTVFTVRLPMKQNQLETSAPEAAAS